MTTDPRHIDIQQINNLGRTDLENECIYLMKKRIVLEDVIADKNKRLEGCVNAVKNRDRTIDQLQSSMEAQTRIMNQQLEKSNRQNDEYLQEIERLRGVVRELKPDVTEH